MLFINRSDTSLSGSTSQVEMSNGKDTWDGDFEAQLSPRGSLSETHHGFDNAAWEWCANILQKVNSSIYLSQESFEKTNPSV